MPSARWRFRKMTRGELNQNPMERELLSEEGTNINERLVREAIQNSLDASIAHVSGTPSGGPPVRVRFSLRGAHRPLPADRAAEYLEGLAPHLRHGLDERDEFRGRDLEGADMPYLVIEDAGTVGLEGDWRRYDDTADNPAKGEHFYWFFRNIGRSGKGDADAGSWGLGKWVFPDASKVSAYIAVTRRRADGETLLMGQSVLQKHTIDEQRYPPYGYYAEMDAEDLAVPLRVSEPTHRPVIEQCIADFGLQFRDELGLSVIIPFPRVDEESPLDRSEILAAVVHNYFYPIIAGKLEVTVDDGTDFTEVTGDTIDEVLRHLPLDTSGEQSAESYSLLFAMCREAATLPDREFIELSAPPQLGDRYEHRAAILDMRNRFEEDDLLAFRIVTEVQRKNDDQPSTATSFRLYVQRNLNLEKGHDYYVRGALSIPGMDLIGRHQAQTLLVVDEGEPLAAMLRDSEPPAHTLWRPQYEGVRKLWVAPQRRIEDVRQSADRLLSIWTSQPVDFQRDALAHIFPSSGGGRQPGSTDRPGDRTSTRRVPLPPSPPAFDIQRTGDGFRVRFASALENPPERVRLRVAYETPRGNPLKGYSPHDFRLHGEGALHREPVGCQVQPGETANELLLTISDAKQFSLTVHGFDERRDVHVRVEPAPSTGQSGGEDDDTQT